MKLLQIILLIILLILSALLIAINLKLYKINNIKRGGQLDPSLLINTYGDQYNSLSENDKKLFIVYLDKIDINSNEAFNQTVNNDKLLNMWLEHRDAQGDWQEEDMQNAIAASLLDNIQFTLPLQNAEYDRLYNLWLHSSSLIRSTNPSLKKMIIMIQCTFPNFFSNIIESEIDINNSQLQNTLTVRRHNFTESNIYFDIKYIIWRHCVKNGLILDNIEDMQWFFMNTQLDACDINGWVLQSFIYNSNIYKFINDQANMENIVFVPRVDNNAASFVKKNIVFGRIHTIGIDDNARILIREGYYGSRQVAGDGNCYYTAFIFNLLEFALYSDSVTRKTIGQNVITALNDAVLQIPDNYKIYKYDTESKQWEHLMMFSQMKKYYKSMIDKLTAFFASKPSIFDLEGLFNGQYDNGQYDNGQYDNSITIPLVYGCKLLIRKYMVANIQNIPDGLSTTIMDIATKYKSDVLNNRLDFALNVFLQHNILSIYYDMADIVEIPILAYSFKCRQNIISLTRGNIQLYAPYTEYYDPYTMEYISDKLLGEVNLILRPGHYDIVYRRDSIYHHNIIPLPFVPIAPLTSSIISRPSEMKRVPSKMKRVPEEQEQIIIEGKIITEEQIMNVLVTLSTTELNKLIECKQDKINKYSNLADSAYYIDNNPFYDNDSDQYKLDKKILELAKSITTYTKIPEIDSSIVNILVYCHPRKIEKAEDHFLYSHFIERIHKYCANKYYLYKIYTLDIRGDSDFIVDDGFSDEFISAQNNKWDIIFIPDCGGQWVENQDIWILPRPFKIDWFLDKIPKIINMLKKNGELYFGKIVNPDNQTQIITKLKHLGYFTNTINFDFDNMILVVKI